MASQQKREDSERTVPNPVQVRKFLGGPDYPAGKQALLDRAREEDEDADENVGLVCVPDHVCDSLTAGSPEVGRLD
ncbi:MAG: hypothetical protein ROZ37_12225 [Aromatoleum sp.]|jgi:hypothetical protein|uniref:DUF2795 domain-containing protein n=1 Tax=Aromatoleum sp. TaxID=2307007 RepID=UPI002895DD13|nr:hypothetical protein [Aromatoleum sp.]MDT3671085.1 hypothetical protein [Aromatoleum sp.]